MEDNRWHQLMGALFALLVAGVIGGVATYAAVSALDTNVHLFREEVRREFDWYQAQVGRLENKIDVHLNEHNNQNRNR